MANHIRLIGFTLAWSVVSTGAVFALVLLLD
jgi:hypothetical protein